MINLEAHQHFFQTGKTYSISWRKKQLRLLLKSINKNEKALYKAFKTDLHKGKFETLTSEIGLIKRSIRNTLKHLSEWTEPKRKKTPFLLFGRTSHTVYEPYGTVLIIGPFNYPFLSVMEPLIGAIAAGNTAVIKPSELTPNVSSVIETLIEATFPKHYVQAVTGGVETTEKLLSKDFDFIFFTGSPRVGKIVMEKASDHLTPVLLELGGKSPAIVGKDANVKLAAKRIVWGKLMNTGQTCIAPDYCLVHSSLKDSLVKKMIKEIKVLYGTDAQKSKDYGRIVSDKHADRLSKMIDGHQNDIIYGGGKNGQYIEPTLLELETAWKIKS
jgi:aldehyde dehydrogenase (NAD+)